MSRRADRKTTWRAVQRDRTNWLTDRIKDLHPLVPGNKDPVVVPHRNPTDLLEGKSPLRRFDVSQPILPRLPLLQHVQCETGRQATATVGRGIHPPDGQAVRKLRSDSNSDFRAGLSLRYMTATIVVRRGPRGQLPFCPVEQVAGIRPGREMG